MQTPNNQLTQPMSLPPSNNQPAPAKAENFFSLSRRQLIGISFVGGITLLLIFGLGIQAGEKRALRKQSSPQTQPTPTNIQPSPTTVPTPTPISPPASLPTKLNEQGTVDQSCFEGDDCVIGIEQGSQTIYSRGICKNGACVPRPTSVPKSEEVKSPNR